MKYTYQEGVEVVVCPFIVNKDGKILLVKSHEWGDVYLLPGGHVEPGERIIDAAKREGEEETGLKLNPLYCINVGELINSPALNRKAHLVYFHYVCEALTDDIYLEEGELKDFVWINPKDISKLNLSDLMKKTINNYLNGMKTDITSEVF